MEDLEVSKGNQNNYARVFVESKFNHYLATILPSTVLQAPVNTGRFGVELQTPVFDYFYVSYLGV